jgi:hypothetical protein
MWPGQPQESEMLKLIRWIIDGFKEIHELKEERRMEQHIDILSYYSRNNRFPPGSALERYRDKS